MNELRRALPVITCLAAVASCQASGDDASDPIAFGPPVAAPVDRSVTVLPTAGAPEASSYLEPVALGVEFDAVIRGGVSIHGYVLDGVSYDPGVILIFAGEDYFTAEEEDEAAPDHCMALGTWVADEGAELTAWDGQSFHVDYDGTLTIAQHNCHDRLDPAKHGPDGEDFIARFDGMRLGFGFAPLTDDLREGWPASVLDDWGPAMFSSYVAIRDLEGEYVAQDISTSFAIAVRDTTDHVLVDADGFLIPIDIEQLSPDEPLPDLYANTIATWFLTLDSLAVDLTL